MPRMIVNPLFEESDEFNDHLGDDNSIEVELFPEKNRQYAKIELEADTWPNSQMKGETRRMRAMLTVTIPSIREYSEMLRSAADGGNADNVLIGLDSVSLGAYRVVGRYYRFDNLARSQLIVWRDRITGPLIRKTRRLENFLIAAAPGSGKTHFIQQIALSLTGSIDYVPITLTTVTREQYAKYVQQCLSAPRPTLCLLDEVDARAGDEWIYEDIFSCLNLNEHSERQVVFVLVGSTPGGLPALMSAMSNRSKGGDLISRIPPDHRFEIPPVEPTEDGIVLVCSCVREAAEKRGIVVGFVERMVFYYAIRKKLSPRHLDDLIRGAVARMASHETVLRYGHLFDPSDIENQRFWTQHQREAERFQQTVIQITE